jgi:GntR family transcriptional repressor for pyruvate dehydrogenase complex
LEPIEKTSVVDLAIKQFMSAIKSGKWKQGEKIPGELELVSSLRVSRTSIREALRVLSFFGVVVSKPGYGTVLAPNALRLICNTELAFLLTHDQDMEDLFQVRFFIEPQVAYWAAVKASSSDIKRLEKTFVGCLTKEELANKTTREKLEISSNFHKSLAEITHNKLVVSILESIQVEIDRLRLEVESEWIPEDLDASMLEHKVLLEYIKKRLPEKARNFMFHHLMYGVHLDTGVREETVKEESVKMEE